MERRTGTGSTISDGGKRNSVVEHRELESGGIEDGGEGRNNVIPGKIRRYDADLSSTCSRAQAGKCGDAYSIE